MTSKKKFLPLLFSIFFLYTSAYAQTENCNCKNDLIFLDSKIKKTTSFKNNESAYIKSYQEKLKEADTITSNYDCYILLNTLLLSINDNHSRVYGLEMGATEEIKNDSIKFSEFLVSSIFKAYPKPNINLDSLVNILSAKSPSDIEGIYRRNGYMTIGVYKNTKQNNYKAIVLDPETKVWSKGEIVYTLIPFGNNYLLNVGGNISSKRMITYTERIENGFFLFMGFQKDSSLSNYATKTPTEDTYSRKELSSDITYLKIGSFSSWNPTLSQAEKFYKSMAGTLNKPHLVLDLRNNGGGGDRNSDILFKILKEYQKKNTIYVMINHITASNAEQFAYKLNKFENCQLFGQRTNGTLSYELVNSNYDLPCGNFTVSLTSKTHSDYLDIESIGIEPSIKFDVQSDWLDQMVKYIEEKKSIN